jgi:Flp pilus assembly protein TadG
MPSGRPRSRRRLTDLFGSQSGAAAVEFAMVALPFFALLFSILELGMMFMTSTTIEAATVSAARQIRTGQLQQGGSNSAAGFKTLICNGMSWISTADCVANMSIDVRTFPNFAAVTVTPPIANNQIDQTQLTYNAGNACDIVLVRAFYPYTLLTPLLEPGMPNLGPNQRLITTAVAFRNENWQAEGPPCS